MEGVQDEQLLSLGLAIVIDSGSGRERKVKRKRREGFKPLDTNGVSEGNIYSLLEMREIMLKKENKTPEISTGDSVQRVAAYFADGLVARLLTRRSPFHSMIMKEPAPEDEFLAYMELYNILPVCSFHRKPVDHGIIRKGRKK
ncbi:unnamed protein product [Lactuca virosa]|uniref:Uncharacterized protein n=1 Tax=Lactuca virosa TaxID=75947 RepID=A0AAU9PTX1_9ASTR|nr:unnamed protein product [Lactuca virosa]